MKGFEEFKALMKRLPVMKFPAGIVAATADGLALLVMAVGKGGYRPMTGEEYDQNVQG